MLKFVLIVSLLFALAVTATKPPPATLPPSTSLKPSLNCACRINATLGYASFNYTNEDSVSVTVPAGTSRNRFKSGGDDQGQPSTFLPGTHFGVEVTFPCSAGPQCGQTWYLHKQGDRVYSAQAPCSDMPCGEGVCGFSPPPVAPRIKVSCRFNATTQYVQFAYENSLVTTVTIPVGTNNFHTPAPIDLGQPTVFNAGYNDAHTAYFSCIDEGASLKWTLASPATATFAESAISDCSMLSCERVDEPLVPRQEANVIVSEACKCANPRRIYDDLSMPRSERSLRNYTCTTVFDVRNIGSTTLSWPAQSTQNFVSGPILAIRQQKTTFPPGVLVTHALEVDWDCMKRRARLTYAVADATGIYGVAHASGFGKRVHPITGGVVQSFYEFPVFFSQGLATITGADGPDMLQCDGSHCGVAPFACQPGQARRNASGIDTDVSATYGVHSYPRECTVSENATSSIYWPLLDTTINLIGNASGPALWRYAGANVLATGSYGDSNDETRGFPTLRPLYTEFVRQLTLLHGSSSHDNNAGVMSDGQPTDRISANRPADVARALMAQCTRLLNDEDARVADLLESIDVVVGDMRALLVDDVTAPIEHALARLVDLQDTNYGLPFFFMQIYSYTDVPVRIGTILDQTYVDITSNAAAMLVTSSFPPAYTGLPPASNHSDIANVRVLRKLLTFSTYAAPVQDDDVDAYARVVSAIRAAAVAVPSQNRTFAFAQQLAAPANLTLLFEFLTELPASQLRFAEMSFEGQFSNTDSDGAIMRMFSSIATNVSRSDLEVYMRVYTTAIAIDKFVSFQRAMFTTSKVAQARYTETTPGGWLCSSYKYGDGKCNCECASDDESWDPDCGPISASPFFADAPSAPTMTCDIDNRANGAYWSGPGFGTDKVMPLGIGGRCVRGATPADAPTCQRDGVPAGWRCQPWRYGGPDKRCDGACASNATSVDPDCYNPVATPAGWTCAPDMYGNGECDCECGVFDMDCVGSTAPNCPGGGVPDGWLSDPAYYNADDGCDCAAGILDPDCTRPYTDIYGCYGGEQYCSANATCTNNPLEAGTPADVPASVPVYCSHVATCTTDISQRGTANDLPPPTILTEFSGAEIGPGRLQVKVVTSVFDPIYLPVDTYTHGPAALWTCTMNTTLGHYTCQGAGPPAARSISRSADAEPVGTRPVSRAQKHGTATDSPSSVKFESLTPQSLAARVDEWFGALSSRSNETAPASAPFALPTAVERARAVASARAMYAGVIDDMLARADRIISARASRSVPVDAFFVDAPSFESETFATEVCAWGLVFYESGSASLSGTYSNKNTFRQWAIEPVMRDLVAQGTFDGILDTVVPTTVDAAVEHIESAFSAGIITEAGRNRTITALQTLQVAAEELTTPRILHDESIPSMHMHATLFYANEISSRFASLRSARRAGIVPTYSTLDILPYANLFYNNVRPNLEMALAFAAGTSWNRKWLANSIDTETAFISNVFAHEIGHLLHTNVAPLIDSPDAAIIQSDSLRIRRYAQTLTSIEGFVQTLQAPPSTRISTIEKSADILALQLQVRVIEKRLLADGATPAQRRAALRHLFIAQAQAWAYTYFEVVVALTNQEVSNYFMPQHRGYGVAQTMDEFWDAFETPRPADMPHIGVFSQPTIPGLDFFTLVDELAAIARPPVPAGWLCAANKYAAGDGICDCGCGPVDDPDCGTLPSGRVTFTHLGTRLFPYVNGRVRCDGYAGGARNTRCVRDQATGWSKCERPVPEFPLWRGSVEAWADGRVCDCGYGAHVDVLDPDCTRDGPLPFIAGVTEMELRCGNDANSLSSSTYNLLVPEGTRCEVPAGSTRPRCVYPETV